ncbi:ribulose-5-phosphate 3-epimerase [Thermaerobacter marianensis DSM 12885]|uniref:Ribulose-phosphate 3-epimerase n=1 Tax=Thermaerobacter marianensis (strain ATCC 700841 / DSM 12885 / JCM 10246 / 7p75a) TaxID=644966 RepID=E6SJB1_THEM7|nr:ribulose-phosphate 3-epimerase [Thermaerobacter marianensis]ADU51039.1 ribulose-5-phosphate 3-epimerase [Thermaerobacter marianensis DSM 12885]
MTGPGGQDGNRAAAGNWVRTNPAAAGAEGAGAAGPPPVAADPAPRGGPHARSLPWPAPGAAPAVLPSLLSADFTRLAEQVKAAEEAGAAGLHLDVMDGRFVPNLTFGPLIIAAVRRLTALPLDVHLMVERPEGLLAAVAQAGADLITVHVEATPHVHRAVQMIRALGCRAGVALNPGTPAAAVEPLLGEVDLILVMSVNPGFAGQAFLPLALDKLRTLRAMLPAAGPRPWLEVDGGIDPKTAPLAAAAGADLLVAGSSVFNDRAPVRTNLHHLRQALTAPGAVRP